MNTSGGGGFPNDPAPTGTVKAQAAWVSLNGQTVSGTVTVYLLESGSYVVRLNGLSAPSETGLSLRVTASGQQVISTSLRATGGSQNYSVSPSFANPRWEKATIRSNTAGLDYGEALLAGS